MQNKSASLRESNVERKKRCRLQNKIEKNQQAKSHLFAIGKSLALIRTD